MGRKAEFTDDVIFREVARQVASGQMATIRDISGATGVSVGSLYHRFDGVEAILAECWLWAVESFQAGFLMALEPLNEQAGLQAALHTPRFCQAEPDKALVLAHGNRNALVRSGISDDLQQRVGQADTAIAAAIQEFAESQRRDRDVTDLALIGFPLTVVRLYLPNRPVPEIAKRHIRTTYKALLRG